MMRYARLLVLLPILFSPLLYSEARPSVTIDGVPSAKGGANDGATAANGVTHDGVPPANPVTIDGVLHALADDDAQGRDNLTPGGELARERMKTLFGTLKLRPAGTRPGSFEQPFDEGVNLLAIYEPPGTAGQPPAVLIGAHYDHTGTECCARARAVSPVCNGAADNAAGVAAAVAAVEALAGKVHHPIAIALWDAEEDGRLGSEYFAAHPTFAVGSLRLYINLDIIGLNLFRGGEALHFLIGSETGGPSLVSDVDASTRGLALQARRLSYAFGRGRGDIDSFVNAGHLVPFVFLSDGDGGVYHTTADELSVLNTAKVEASSNLVARRAFRASEGAGYVYAPPPVVTLPVYPDTIVVRDSLRLLLKHADANRLVEAQRVGLNDRIQALDNIVLAGQDAWSQASAAQVAAAAMHVIDLSSELAIVP